MTDQADNNASGKGFSAWLFGAIFKGGWRRRIIFVIAVILFFILLSFLRDSIDYQSDPSALIPRDAALFVETRQIGQVTKKIAMWPLWIDERRASGDEQWNHIQASVAAVIGEVVHGFGSRLPLSWLESANRAAICVSKGDPGKKRPWAIYLEIQSPSNALKELRQEPSITIAKYRENNEQLLEIKGNDQSKLSVGAIGPWLVVASDSSSLLFAADAIQKPSLTLASARILPAWGRHTEIRGAVDPSEMIGRRQNAEQSRIGSWMRPDSRFTFAAAINDSTIDEIHIEHLLLGDARGGNWVWSLIKFLLSLVALLCLVLAASIIVVMLGWGGWLKLAAEKAGIRPAVGPAPVEPSAAFTADAGLASFVGVDDNTDQLKPEDNRPETPSVAGCAVRTPDYEEEELENEPLAIFPEIQSADMVDEISGHLVDEEEKPTRGKTRANITKSKSSSQSAFASPDELENNGSDDQPDTPVKPKRRTIRKKNEEES